MNNTVVLKGAGNGVYLTFLMLAEHFDNSIVVLLPLKWWQTTQRYEFRLQNATAKQIDYMLHVAHDFRPLSSRISIEVF